MQHHAFRISRLHSADYVTIHVPTALCSDNQIETLATIKVKRGLGAAGKA